MSESNGSTKTLLQIALAVAGGVLVILWGVAWGDIQDNAKRIQAVEVTEAGKTEVLKEIDRRLERIENLLRTKKDGQ